MARSFQTDEGHGSESLRPLRVPSLKQGIFHAAKEMVDDLDRWELTNEDPESGQLVCRRDGGFLGGTATIVISVDGPDGVPSTTVQVRSETQGGLFPRDKANVVEFMKPFHRRVC